MGVTYSILGVTFALLETISLATLLLTGDADMAAHRPVQVTRDLAGFWRTSYFDVRKDMRGRYPKHDWPENPLLAVPTKRTKRSTPG